MTVNALHRLKKRNLGGGGWGRGSSRVFQRIPPACVHCKTYLGPVAFAWLCHNAVGHLRRHFGSSKVTQVFLLVIQLSVCRGFVYRWDGERARAIVIGSSAGKDDESPGRVASPRWPRRLGPDCAGTSGTAPGRAASPRRPRLLDFDCAGTADTSCTHCTRSATPQT